MERGWESGISNQYSVESGEWRVESGEWRVESGEAVGRVKVWRCRHFLGMDARGWGEVRYGGDDDDKMLELGAGCDGLADGGACYASR